MRNPIVPGGKISIKLRQKELVIKITAPKGHKDVSLKSLDWENALPVFDRDHIVKALRGFIEGLESAAI